MRTAASSFGHYKPEKSGLIERLDAERTRFLEFAARIGTNNHEARLLADRARDLGTERLDPLSGVLTRHRFERAGDHHRLSSKRLRADGRDLSFADGFHAGLPQRIHKLAVARLVEPPPDRFGANGTNVGGFLQFVDRCGLDRFNRAEMIGKHFRASFTDVPDAQPVDYPPRAV